MKKSRKIMWECKVNKNSLFWYDVYHIHISSEDKQYVTINGNQPDHLLSGNVIQGISSKDT